MAFRQLERLAAEDGNSSLAQAKSRGAGKYTYKAGIFEAHLCFNKLRGNNSKATRHCGQFWAARKVLCHSMAQFSGLLAVVRDWGTNFCGTSPNKIVP